jgi:hypothetical protein
LGFEASAGDSAVSLNWTAPSYLGPGTIVYHLFRNGSEIWNGTGLTYHDNAVSNGITYSYQLDASNSVGRGPNCTAVQATPQPVGSIPMAPIGLTAMAGNLQVDLNWTAPSYVGIGTITYHLFRDGALVWSGVATEHRDLGLNNGQTYAYKVAASNAIGWGPNCTAEFATTSGVPDTPWGLTWEAGNSQVALSWKAVNYTGPGILIYHLFRDGVVVWNGTSTIHVDTGLVNGHKYEYNVVASNSFGWGRLSTTVEATPIAAASDNTLLYIGVGVIAVVALVGVVFVVSRRRK